MNKKLFIPLLFALLLGGAVLALRLGSGASDFLWDLSRGGTFLLPLISAAALIDSINPCAFSILLLTIGFLFSLGALRGGILRIGLSYVFGIFVAYIAIGLGLLQALHLFDTPHFMGVLGSWLLIGLGLINVIGVLVPRFPIQLRIPSGAHVLMAKLMTKITLPTAFLLGALVGLCEFPCTGGPYLLVIGLLHDQGTFLSGLGYLLLYNALFVVPLILILLIAGNERVLARVALWQQARKMDMRFFGGLAMVVLGLLILLL